MTMTVSQSAEKRRVTLLLTLAFTLVALVLAGRVDAGTASGRTCWQMKFTFIGFPSSSSFARWKLTQGRRTFASGEFSFRGDAGGFYQRHISRCVTGIDENRRVAVAVRTLYWPCQTDCHILAAIRERP